MHVYAKRHINSREGARELLARAVREVWGLSPMPEMVREERGKPRFSAHPDCHFNLSHSGEFALCALDDAPVGADIQIIRRDLRESVPKRVCSPEELDWLRGQADCWAAFAQLWSLKEARVKLTGEGLGALLSGIAVPLPKDGAGLYRLDGIWFRVYDVPGCGCAVCGENPPPEDMIWLS